MNSDPAEIRRDTQPDTQPVGRFEPAPETIDSGQLALAEQMPRERRVVLPVVLFVLTCLSTFWVGATDFQPLQSLLIAAADGSLMNVRRLLLVHWPQGLIYMVAVLSILFAHEMGHFVATLIYRIPASLPFFLPFPINPIGTLGAVIAMQGNLADRRQIFDIGIAGPIAGLVIAIPMTFYGVATLDLTVQPHGGLGFRLPLLMQWIASAYDVPGYVAGQPVWLSQLNPWFTAAWVGLLITGINMMPVGQLDGGHVTYTLFGKAAYVIARGVIVFAVAFMVYNQNYVLVIMVILLLLIGTDHPPTRNDKVAIGPGRWILGLASLSIPVLCFPPLIFDIAY